MLLAALLLALVPADDPPATWPSFRGERARGVASGTPPPAGFDVGSGENVRWRVPVHGLGHAGPVVWGDRVFVATAVRLEGEAALDSLYGSDGYGAGESVPDEGPHAWQVLAFDAATGARLWERTANEGVPQVRRHPKSSHASSTPACDAERVVAFFGSEGLHAFSHDGEPLWSRDFGRLEAGAPDVPDATPYQWGFASSPVLHEGRVLVQVDVQGESFLAALDADTGDDLWRTPRDEPSTWCTPTVVDRGADGRPVVVANGYRSIGGYDLATGDPVWWLSGGGDVPVPTPVCVDDQVYLTSAHGRSAPLTALRATARGAISREPAESEHAVWNHPRRGIYMQTPLVVDGLVYACSDGGALGVYDAETGESVYRERLLDGTTGFSASAVTAGDLVWFTAEQGQVVAVRRGREHEVVAVSDLGEPCLATPAVVDGAMYLRGRTHLVAAGATPARDDEVAWTRFRGPNGAGLADDVRIPDALDLEDGLAWRVETPKGYSSPVLTRDAVVFTTEDGRDLATVALDRETGAERWSAPAPTDAVLRPMSPNSTAPATPTTDGENTYVFFESTGALSYDAAGELRWQRELGEFQNAYGMGTSPVYVADRVLLQLDHDDGSFLVALDAADGEEAWRADRRAFTHGFSTPGVYQPAEGATEVVVSGSYAICGYDLADGAELWRFDGVAWQSKCAPLIVGDTAYVSSWMAAPSDLGAKPITETWEEALAARDADEDGLLQGVECVDLGLERVWFLCDMDDSGALDEEEWQYMAARGRAENGLFAIRLGGRGDVRTSHLRWTFDRSLPNVPSPLVVGDELYVLKESGILTALDPASGERRFAGRVEGMEDAYYASPVSDGERILFASHPWRLGVMAAGEDLEMLSILELDEELWATPALGDWRIFVRSQEAVYAFRAEPERP